MTRMDTGFCRAHTMGPTQVHVENLRPLGSLERMTVAQPLDLLKRPVRCCKLENGVPWLR